MLCDSEDAGGWARCWSRWRPCLPWLLLALGLGACTRSRPETAVDEAALARLGREAEAALSRIGEGRFAVVEFRRGGAGRLEFDDDFDFRTRMLALGFEARVRFVGDLSVRGHDEMRGRCGQPGWSLDETALDFELLSLLGPGPRRRGEEAAVRAAAMFDDLEPGWRFNQFDRPR